jgi:predicted nucleic acid-binding protein
LGEIKGKTGISLTMTLIIDSNILISAALNADSDIYKLITKLYLKIDFVTPELSLLEIKLHKKRICKNAKLETKEFDINLANLLSNIILLPHEEVSDHEIKKAESLTRDIDLKDTIFIAFSLVLDALIWTGDLKLYKALRRKSFSNIITTKELKQIIKGL